MVCEQHSNASGDKNSPWLLVTARRAIGDSRPYPRLENIHARTLEWADFQSTLGGWSRVDRTYRPISLMNFNPSLL